MRIRLQVAISLLAVGCSASERVEGMEEAESARTVGSGSAQAASDEGSNSLPTATETTPTSQRPSSPISGPLAETSCPVLTDAAAIRASVSPPCPGGCLAMPAAAFDQANQCVKRVLLACIPGLTQISSVLACYRRREDGLIIRTGGPVQEVLGSAWVECTKEDLTKWSETRCSE